MKWLLWALPLLTACHGTSTEQRVLDREGRIRAVVTREDGKKNGPVRFYNADGTLRTSGAYANDSRHGAWVTVTPDGDTLSIVQFRYGQKDGTQAYWAPNGQILRVESFSEGEPNGPLYRFFSDGEPRQFSWYHHGIQEGKYMEWYKVDSLHTALSAGSFNDGKRDGPWHWYYSNGRLKGSGAYRDGKRCGTWTYWDLHGKPTGTKDYGP